MTNSAAWLVVALSTVAVMVSVDILLPTVPLLPAALQTTPAAIQYVLAAYVGGSSFGLIAIGTIADRFRRQSLLGWTLCAFAVFSVACAFAEDARTLTFLRLMQGLASSSVGVLLPPIVKQLSGDAARATRAMTFVGAAQALIPGTAPIAGLWLLHLGGWPTSFFAVAILGGGAGLALLLRPNLMPRETISKSVGKSDYKALLVDRRFLGYAISHALLTGGLVTLALSLPAALRATSADPTHEFVTIQITLMASFVGASIIAGLIVAHVGEMWLIRVGTALAAVGSLIHLGYAAAGGDRVPFIILTLLPLVVGVGFRGGAGFVRALNVAPNFEARASAILIFLSTIAPASATALIAPYLDAGLPVLAVAVCCLVLLGAGSFWVLTWPRSATNGRLNDPSTPVRVRAADKVTPGGEMVSSVPMGLRHTKAGRNDTGGA